MIFQWVYLLINPRFILPKWKTCCLPQTSHFQKKLPVMQWLISSCHWGSKYLGKRAVKVNARPENFILKWDGQMEEWVKNKETDKTRKLLVVWRGIQCLELMTGWDSGYDVSLWKDLLSSSTYWMAGMESFQLAKCMFSAHQRAGDSAPLIPTQAGRPCPTKEGFRKLSFVNEWTESDAVSGLTLGYCSRQS